MSYRFINPANRELFESLFSKEISNANLKFERQEMKFNEQTRPVTSFPSEDYYYYYESYDEEDNSGPIYDSYDDDYE